MGAKKTGVFVVAEILELAQTEIVRLDQDRLQALFVQLGEVEAENVVCRAIEELAVRLAHCERLWRTGETDDLRKCARSLAAIADQIGMSTLTRASRDLTNAIDSADGPAIGATLFRLIRTGERSLTAVWDLQDMSV